MTTGSDIHRSLRQIRPLAAVTRNILEVVAGNEPSTDQLLSILRDEPEVTQVVVRLSNSGSHDVPKRIVDLSETVAYLGTANLVRMVVAQCLSSYFTEGGGGGNATLPIWQHSVACGIAAELIAEASGAADPAAAFAAGLLHDIGKLALVTHCKAHAAELCEDAKADRRSYVETEREVLGIDHTSAGGLLAERWRLPPDLRHAVRNHHNPELQSVDHELTTVVHVADLMVLQMGLGLGPEGLNYPVWRGAVKRINFQAHELDRVRLLLIAELRRAAALMKLPVQPNLRP